MRWKLWLTIFLIAGIAYLLFFSSATRQYTQFFRSKLGEFISIFQKKTEGKLFEISIRVNKESLGNLTLDFPNSTIVLSGEFYSLTIGEQKIANQNVEKVSLKEFSGSLEKRGNYFKIVGNCKNYEINDLIFFSEKFLKVEIEATPSEISLFNIKSSEIILLNANGEIKRIKDGVYDQITLKNSYVEIKNFEGSLTISGDELRMSGLTEHVKGKDFVLSEI